MRERELYNILLAMQQKAIGAGFIDFARECYEFRMDLLDRYFRTIDPLYAAAVDLRMRNGIGWRP